MEQPLNDEGARDFTLDVQGLAYVVEHVSVLLDFHVVCLRYRSHRIQMINEGSIVHEDSSSIRFATIQAECFYWGARRITSQEGPAGLVDAFAEHEAAIVIEHFLQCLVDAGNKEIVSDGGACVTVFDGPEFIWKTFNQSGKGV
ncbi:hypothetical protein IV203_028846 [Nitzschia inconspicua]|uniref:Uncharacterized protein n=1 Tax=Nitzschia inconspicua TaxID=303405 RepID=A0A9K3K917_9STRA|nr:hypothetical protein IV203_004781 [Nitzschia inconspicua]KAG7366176.1 hypothetical protein IV203_028846 [Nitzschia inconspicua]